MVWALCFSATLRVKKKNIQGRRVKVQAFVTAALPPGLFFFVPKQLICQVVLCSRCIIMHYYKVGWSARSLQSCITASCVLVVFCIVGQDDNGDDSWLSWGLTCRSEHELFMKWWVNEWKGRALKAVFWLLPGRTNRGCWFQLVQSVVFSRQTNHSGVGMIRPGNVGSVLSVQICPNKPSQRGNILQLIQVWKFDAKSLGKFHLLSLQTSPSFSCGCECKPKSNP